jgi:hypothetical protein
MTYLCIKDGAMIQKQQKYASLINKLEKKVFASQRRRGRGGLREGTHLLLWKIWSQLSSISGENISQIFFDFGRKYPSRFFQFWEKISFKYSPIWEKNSG